MQHHHIDRLRSLIIGYRLAAPDAFFAATPAELHAIYNGIGPDRWSARFRATVTRILRDYEPEALIHDWEYARAPRTYRAFTAANIRFAANAARTARNRYGLSPCVFRHTLRGTLLALICQLFGNQAWQQSSTIEG